MRTRVEAVFEAFYDRRATAQPINALFLVSLFRFQILDGAEYDCRKVGDLGNIQSLLESNAEYRSGNKGDQRM